MGVESGLPCYTGWALPCAFFPLNPMSNYWPPYPHDPDKYLHFPDVKASIKKWIEREDTYDIAILKIEELEKAPQGIKEAIICCNSYCSEEFTPHNYPKDSVVIIDLIQPSTEHKNTCMANFVKSADCPKKEPLTDALKISDVMSQSNTFDPSIKVKKVAMLEADVQRWEQLMMRTGTNSWKSFNQLLNMANV